MSIHPRSVRGILFLSYSVILYAAFVNSSCRSLVAAFVCFGRDFLHYNPDLCSISVIPPCISYLILACMRIILTIHIPDSNPNQIGPAGRSSQFRYLFRRHPVCSSRVCIMVPALAHLVRTTQPTGHNGKRTVHIVHYIPQRVAFLGMHASSLSMTLAFFSLLRNA